MENKIQKILKKLEVKMKAKKSKSNYPKLLALTYLAVAIEKIMQNPTNNKPLSDLSDLVDRASLMYDSYLEIDNFAGTKNSQSYSIKAVHKDLWGKIWPKYDLKSFQDLINYRKKRITYNHLQKYIIGKNILEFGSGNGSISTGCLQLGAKFVQGYDYNKKNIEFSKKIAKKLSYKNFNFTTADIRKIKSNKKFDFLICSAVLHHLDTFSEVEKTLQNMKRMANHKSRLYLFVRGYGGIRYAVQDFCRLQTKNISTDEIGIFLNSLSLNRNKFTHLLDWFKAKYLQFSKSKIDSIFKRQGIKILKRLEGPHINDMDINQLQQHRFSKIKFGTGEQRYLCEFIF
jgi:ubiquinone/menaquinone biosynthesis C-methylase UbiE